MNPADYAVGSPVAFGSSRQRSPCDRCGCDVFTADAHSRSIRKKLCMHCFLAMLEAGDIHAVEFPPTHRTH
jgi:hypothetical protein